MEFKEELMCIACENNEVEYFTLYKGNLMCSHCLSDWLKDKIETDFDKWLLKQRERSVICVVQLHIATQSMTNRKEERSNGKINS